MQIVRPLSLSFDDYTTDVTEDDAPVWDNVTAYDIGDQVIREHIIYASTIDSNTDNDPALENLNLTSTKWLYVGYTNAFRFVDGTIGNRTEGGTSVQIDVANVGGAEALLFFGVKASTVQVQGFDSGASEVYNETISLSGRETYGFYSWLTEPLGEAGNKVVVTDLPSYEITDITITIAGTAIELGELVIGDVVNIGTALMGPTEGEVKSYTRFEFNAYGQLVRIPGPTRTIMRYSVHTPASTFPTVKDAMDRMAGTMVAAIGAASRPSTVQLGILGTIRWPEDLPNDYIYKFQLDGVT